MSEKIKQLAAQVRGNMVCLTTVDDVQWKQHEEFVEEFAKLIIQECVIVCKTGGVSNSDYNTGRLHCAVGIKEHFGIE